MQRKEYAKKVEKEDASRLRIGVVVARFNSDITSSLLNGALAVLEEWGVKKANIKIVEVPGSFEIPYGCVRLLGKNKLDAIVALGCIIKGETSHDHYIASAVSHGIMNVSLQYKTPVAFGVLTTNNLKQAKVRSQGKHNKGREAALAALQCALSFDSRK